MFAEVVVRVIATVIGTVMTTVPVAVFAQVTVRGTTTVIVTVTGTHRSTVSVYSSGFSNGHRYWGTHYMKGVVLYRSHLHRLHISSELTVVESNQSI